MLPLALPLRVRVDLEMMTVNGHSSLPRDLELEPQQQIQFHTQDTHLFDVILSPQQGIESVYSDRL